MDPEIFRQVMQQLSDVSEYFRMLDTYYSTLSFISIKFNVILGPVGLPLVGAFREIKDPKNIHKDFMRLRQKYGDVFSMYMGRK